MRTTTSTSVQAMATTTGPKISSRARRKLLSPPENSVGTWKTPPVSGPLVGGNPPVSTCSAGLASPSSRYSLMESNWVSLMTAPMSLVSSSGSPTRIDPSTRKPDGRVVAAHLQGQVAQALPGPAGDAPADLGRAGEGDLVHAGV